MIRVARSDGPHEPRSNSAIRRTTIVCTLLMLTGCLAEQRDSSGTSATAENSLERVAEKGPVKLTVRITPREPRLSDLVQMDVEVVAQPGVDIKPPEFGQAVGDFVVRDYTEQRDPTAVSRPGEPVARRFRYKLEPLHAGRHLIRSIAIEFTDHRVNTEVSGEPILLETDPLEVQVTSELGDQVPSLANLEPMLPPRPISSAWPWSWVLGLMFAGLGIVLFVVFRRRRQFRQPEPRRLTAEEIAHAALSALLAEDLPGQGLFKEFYVRLTGIVRQYIEATTGLRAPEQTTEEFLRAMRSRQVFSVERSGRLTEFLEAADMVKYAGQQPDDQQIMLSIGRAREFVDRKATAEPGCPVMATEA